MLKNTECGYSSQHPQWDSSIKNPQSVFGEKKSRKYHNFLSKKCHWNKAIFLHWFVNIMIARLNHRIHLFKASSAVQIVSDHKYINLFYQIHHQVSWHDFNLSVFWLSMCHNTNVSITSQASELKKKGQRQTEILQHIHITSPYFGVLIKFHSGTKTSLPEAEQFPS